MVNISHLVQSQEFGLKAQNKPSNNSIMLLNKQIENRQIDNALLKTTYPIYLYKPPFGYPRNINVVFLRELAKNPYVFSVIKAIIDQAAETKWEIKLKEGVEMSDKLEEDKRFITEFFKNPNSDNESFAQLLRKVISDILILDSGCLIKIYNRKKELVQLRAMDSGSVLKNPDRFGSLASRADYIDADGYFGIGANASNNLNPPKAYKLALDRYESYGYNEEAAYFQFAYGVNYSVPIPYGRKEIIYMMENPDTETVYSRSSALQSAVDITLNLIYSSKASLDLFLNANIPTGIIQLAEAMQEDTEAFQQKLYNQQYSGYDEYGFQRKINGKLPVVGNPNVNFIPLNFKNSESQLLEIQEWFTKCLWMCYDEETEILTNKGWKYFKDLDKTEEVARINPETLKMDFVKPQDYQEYNFEGNMIEYKNRNCDLLVTPEHKMLYSNMSSFRGGNYNFVQAEARDLFDKDIVVPQAPLEYEGNQIEEMYFETRINTSWSNTKKESFNISGDNFCKFMGIWLADGCTDSTSNRISICAGEVYPENIEFIKSLLDDMKVKYSISINEANTKIRGREVNTNGKIYNFRFSSKSFADYLKQFGKAYTKFVPNEIKNTTKEQLIMFFNAYELGDGCKASNGKNRRFFSMSKQLIDDCQEMMLRLGIASNINEWNNGYELTERKVKTELHKNKYFSYIYKDSIKEKYYNGKVYDVTVPEHHFLVVRRNGRITLSGNCFGVNSSELGFTAGDSRATDQSQTKNNARKAVKPRLSLIANYLNDMVMSELPSGDLFEFCFDEYDIEEDTKKWTLYEQKIRMGVLTPEMVAEKEGIDVEELKKQKEEALKQQMSMQGNGKGNDNNGDGNDNDFNFDDDEEFKSFPELKHKYIKRTGSSGNYEYEYKEEQTKESKNKTYLNEKDKTKIFEEFGKDIRIKKVRTHNLTGFVIIKDNETVGTYINGVIKKKENYESSEDKLKNIIINIKNKGGDFNDFIKKQKDTIFRGGTELAKQKETNSGVSFSTSKQVAEDFATNKGGNVKKFYISPDAKIISFKNVPDVKFKEINDYSPELDTEDNSIWNKLEIEYQKAVDWARENKYDAVKLPLEGEYRVLNIKIIKGENELKELWDSTKLDKDKKELKSVYDGAKEYNQEVDNMMSNNVEVKSNPLDNKTQLENVFDDFIEEYDRIVKKAINNIK